MAAITKPIKRQMAIKLLNRMQFESISDFSLKLIRCRRKKISPLELLLAIGISPQEMHATLCIDHHALPAGLCEKYGFEPLKER